MEQARGPPGLLMPHLSGELLFVMSLPMTGAPRRMLKLPDCQCRDNYAYTDGKQLCTYTGPMPLVSSQQLCGWSDWYHMLMPGTLCDVV